MRHDRCAQRVGTDGVLLGAWADVGQARNILDIGCGSGLIALMAAQRQPEARVWGVEVDAASARQAAENAAASPFAPRLQIVCRDIRQFCPPQPFDHILSNPPFHTEQTLPPDAARATARAAAMLPFGELVDCAARLLAPGGRFSVIVPERSADEFISLCLLRGLRPARQCRVRTTEAKPPRRRLMTFSAAAAELVVPCETLVLHDATGGRSPEYRRLTADFYLAEADFGPKASEE